MKLTPEFIVALVGRGVEYLAYAAITYGFWLIYPAAGWIVGGVLVLLEKDRVTRADVENEVAMEERESANPQN